MACRERACPSTQGIPSGAQSAASHDQGAGSKPHLAFQVPALRAAIDEAMDAGYRAPVAFFLAGGNAVDPEPKGSMVETEPRIDKVKVRVIFKLRSNFVALNMNRRLEASFCFFFGETDRLHRQEVMIFGSKDGHYL